MDDASKTYEEDEKFLAKLTSKLTAEWVERSKVRAEDAHSAKGSGYAPQSLSQGSGYAPQSGLITGISKEMGDAAMAELTEATQAEEAAIKKRRTL